MLALECQGKGGTGRDGKEFSGLQRVGVRDRVLGAKTLLARGGQLERKRKGLAPAVPMLPMFKCP